MSVHKTGEVMTRKEAIKEIRRLITVVTKFPKWKIVIEGTTSKGNGFKYEKEYK